jgi:hypothetical protein
VSGRRALLVALLLGAGILPLAADMGAPPALPIKNAPYNGRFTFARVSFRPAMWGSGPYEWGLDLGWNHDYPRADTHFMKILNETTSVDLNMDAVIYGFDDPEIFKYPFAYVSEPGRWSVNEKEIAGLRAYLQKGGFVMFDDFLARDFVILEDVMRRALPEARFIEVALDHPLWDSFFKIAEPPRVHPYPQLARGIASRYLGIFEDNDPKKRLLAIADYNNDVGEYWEFSDTGFVPIDLSNEAYKLGVNYVIYAMTH